MSRINKFGRGCVATIPLSIAVIPWGVLAGSFALEAGMTVLESQAMSAVVFAGAIQLVASGMIKAGAGISSILLATFFITARHFLYSMTMRDKIKHLPLRWRVALGFLLTDELFAVCGNQSPERFDRWYALGSGLSFYLVWNIATVIGIIAGSQFPWIHELGLEFAVAATFIAIVIPNIKTTPVLVCVVVALVSSVLLSFYQVSGSLIIASLIAMISGYLSDSLVNRGRRV